MDRTSALFPHSSRYGAHPAFDAARNLPQGSSRQFWIACGIIFLLSLSVRLLGVSHDLPFIYHPDEPINLNTTHAMIKNHSWNPHFFDYHSCSTFNFRLSNW
jgi:hypothetical protein